MFMRYYTRKRSYDDVDQSHETSVNILRTICMSFPQTIEDLFSFFRCWLNCSIAKNHTAKKDVIKLCHLFFKLQAQYGTDVSSEEYFFLYENDFKRRHLGPKTCIYFFNFERQISWIIDWNINNNSKKIYIKWIFLHYKCHIYEDILSMLKYKSYHLIE